MAKIKFGMMMTDARGKLGGQVFSKNRSGSYVRTKVTPVNPQTSFQQASRFLLGALSQAWSSLTRGQIEAWNNAVNEWARTDIFGDLRNPTGKNLFTELNKNAVQAGYSQMTEPPAKEEMPIVTLDKATLGIAANELEVELSGNAVGHTLQFRATPTLSNGTTFVKDKLRVIGYVTGSATQTIDIGADYQTRFGLPLTAGANVWLEMRVVLPKGQVSPPQLIQVVVNA